MDKKELDEYTRRMLEHPEDSKEIMKEYLSKVMPEPVARAYHTMIDGEIAPEQIQIQINKNVLEDFIAGKADISVVSRWFAAPLAPGEVCLCSTCEKMKIVNKKATCTSEFNFGELLKWRKKCFFYKKIGE